MNEQPTYYAIIPAFVRYDEDLKPNEKLMYGEITSLSNKKGFCHASNRYFAELYKVHKNTISKWLSHLKEKGYIYITIIKNNNNEIIERRIGITQMINTPINEKVDTPINEKGEYNNTSINNTSINNIYSHYPSKCKSKQVSLRGGKITKKEVFKKPSIQEVKEYMQIYAVGKGETYNYKEQSEAFIDHFESNGWKVGGKASMQDWKASVRTWLRNAKKFGDTSSKTPKQKSSLSRLTF